LAESKDPAPEKVRVGLEARSYDIQIGQGLLSNIPALFPHVSKTTLLFIVCDEHLKTQASLISKVFHNLGINVAEVVLPSGENQKCLDSASKLFDQLVNARADRKTMVLALGVGVVGDLAGFVAATYNRGLNLFMVPTTLLSMVDSSVGGKVGINHPMGKNLIGAFHQPVGVAIDINVLNSLPDREFRSGLAEVVKYGMILDAGLFGFLEANAAGILAREPGLLVKIIKRSCELKAQVVSQDEREETGLRAILNFGHTFAHAFETIGGYGAWLHGEAVASGMVCANKLSLNRGMIDESIAARMVALLKAFNLPTDPPKLSSTLLLEVMRNDKKSVRGNLRFILAKKLGEVALFDDVTEENVKGVLSPLN